MTGDRWPLILLCAAALAGCASQGTSQDEPLDPRAAAFYATPVIVSDGDDAAVGFLGLRAPRGRDFMEYGRNAAKLQRDGEFAQLKDPDLLEIAWNPERMLCWVNDYEPFDREADCAPIEEAVKTLRDNAELLDRYRRIQGLPPPDGSVSYPGTPFISMTKLTFISMKVDWLQDRPEEAYRKWVEQHRLVQRMCSSTSGFVELAICLVNEGYSIAAIEALLSHAPRVIDGHSVELLQMLAPTTIARFDIPRVMRLWYARLKRSPEVAANSNMLLPNYFANRYYFFAQEVIDTLQGPGAELRDYEREECKCLAMIDPNSSDPRIAVSSQLLALVMSPMPTSLVRSAFGHNRMMALLTIRIRIVTERIPDVEVPAFIAANAKSMSEALAGARIAWDPARRVLSFDDQKKYGPMEVRL